MRLISSIILALYLLSPQVSYAYTYLSLDDREIGMLDGSMIRLIYERYYDLEKTPLETLRQNGIKDGYIINGNRLVSSGSIDRLMSRSALCRSYTCPKFESDGKGIILSGSTYYWVRTREYYRFGQDELFASWLSPYLRDRSSLILQTKKTCPQGTCEIWIPKRYDQWKVGNRIHLTQVDPSNAETLVDILSFEEIVSKNQGTYLASFRSIALQARSYREIKDQNTRIKRIYTDILKNYRYDTSASFDGVFQFEIDELRAHPQRSSFSAFEWVESKTFVCQWYAHLMALLLILSGVKDVSLVKGTSRDIPHIWVKVGEKHYDPTWDDQDDRWQEGWRYFGETRAVFEKDHFDF